MEIIRRGRLPQDLKYRTTCTNCHTEFEFLKGETTNSQSWRNETYVNVKCPLPGCGLLLTVDITE